MCPSPKDDDSRATTGNRGSLNVAMSRVEESQEEKMSVGSCACGAHGLGGTKHAIGMLLQGSELIKADKGLSLLISSRAENVDK